MKNNEKRCSRCILDSSMPNIEFDENGVCNYCKEQENLEKVYLDKEKTQKKLEETIYEIKKKGKKSKYDCIIGISGGVDSTYTLYIAKKFGLRVLAVHLDNGWNSEIATNNIKNTVKKLNVDIKTIKVNWDEFRKLQLAFLKASVPDAEAPTDIGIVATLYRTAVEYGVSYIITGSHVTEGNKMPKEWSYIDGRYIKNVYNKFEKSKLKYFPNLTLFDLFYFTFIKKIKTFPILNYINYNKIDAKNILIKELSWEDYGGKHYESIYTRFLQTYILPQKFNIDKRKVHFSAAVRSGYITRDEAMKKIKEPPLSQETKVQDKKFVIGKLGISETQFDNIMSSKPRSFLDYKTYYTFISITKKIVKRIFKLIGKKEIMFYGVTRIDKE